MQRTIADNNEPLATTALLAIGSVTIFSHTSHDILRLEFHFMSFLACYATLSLWSIFRMMNFEVFIN